MLHEISDARSVKTREFVRTLPVPFLTAQTDMEVRVRTRKSGPNIGSIVIRFTWVLTLVLSWCLVTSCTSPLYAAAAKGDIPAMVRLLDAGESVDGRNSQGYTPLCYVAQEGKIEAVTLLLDRGADPNAKGMDGVSPLHLASRKGHGAIVQMLLDHGADVNRTTDGGYTPLFEAAFYGHADVVEMLLAHKASVDAAASATGATPLYVAAQNGHASVVGSLLAGGATVNLPKSNGETPLHTALRNNHPDVAELLIKHGADTAMRDNKGFSPREIAKGDIKLLVDESFRMECEAHKENWNKNHNEKDLAWLCQIAGQEAFTTAGVSRLIGEPTYKTTEQSLHLCLWWYNVQVAPGIGSGAYRITGTVVLFNGDTAFGQIKVFTKDLFPDSQVGQP
jgi:ankyrin repeat protein